MLPVVYHPLYSAPRLAHGHRFPMQVGCAQAVLLVTEARLPLPFGCDAPCQQPQNPWRACLLLPALLPHMAAHKVFERIYQRLLGSQLVREEQVHVPPALPDDATLGLVHTEEYLQAFNTGSLDEQRVRRIGGCWPRGGPLLLRLPNHPLPLLQLVLPPMAS